MPAESTRASRHLVDAKAVAERLGVPETWVLAKARENAIPHLKLGHYTRFDLDDVDEWLDECKRPGRPITFRGGGPS